MTRGEAFRPTHNIRQKGIITAAWLVGMGVGTVRALRATGNVSQRCPRVTRTQIDGEASRVHQKYELPTIRYTAAAACARPTPRGLHQQMKGQHEDANPFHQKRFEPTIFRPHATGKPQQQEE